ncbi:hypothetical protein RRSWK_04063 [Rhodopirellula sp. SWK7]|nr:hypothetical protein RRSWK_04063 [Rhodopirellula sp. SWK7]
MKVDREPKGFAHRHAFLNRSILPISAWIIAGPTHNVLVIVSFVDGSHSQLFIPSCQPRRAADCVANRKDRHGLSQKRTPPHSAFHEHVICSHA